MRFSQLLGGSALLLAPLSAALVGIEWSVSGTPGDGLKDITFAMAMPNNTHTSGYYFAQQFKFVGLSDVGYTGLQPRPDSGSSSIIHAVFSSFVKGTISSDANCHDGADGGSGVSCAVEAKLSYADTYLLQVRNSQGTTWTGTLVNKRTGSSTHIGTYTLPSGSKGIKSSQLGFVEYYPWNSGTHQCNDLPFGSVTFGKPTTSTPDAVGSLGNAYEYGDCVGKVDFETTDSPEGSVSVDVGFN
ncbi:hypothetical protein K431DRAFT_316378 [Polychaeton citri CBS 116435]|uniref:Secreted protein n=1 Tax=Polychaeton citri CBS 116435 TaxID=1314669 RepID=A0A9P4UIA4_9PEZI|nr:hypothetical protein K431DRAFT_316378 [Polychaeton citri CBS 116435]